MPAPVKPLMYLLCIMCPLLIFFIDGRRGARPRNSDGCCDTLGITCAWVIGLVIVFAPTREPLPCIPKTDTWNLIQNTTKMQAHLRGPTINLVELNQRVYDGDIAGAFEIVYRDQLHMGGSLTMWNGNELVRFSAGYRELYTKMLRSICEALLLIDGGTVAGYITYQRCISVDVNDIIRALDVFSTYPFNQGMH